MHLMPSLLAFLVMTQNPATPILPNNEPIFIEETGVARTYEASKTITCGEFQWRVEWSSGPERDNLRGVVTLASNGKSYTAPDAQAELFNKFATINGVSATCNEGANGMPTRTSLLVSGNGRENGTDALAQAHPNGDLVLAWSFDDGG